MNILEKIEEEIKSFNKENNLSFSIDSIRIDFNKKHKLNRLKEIGTWKKLHKNNSILKKLDSRLEENEISTVYQLQNYNAYYFNKRDAGRNKATLVIFGLKQYHRKPIPRTIVLSIVDVLKDVSNIDLCLDLKGEPNFKELKKYFYVNRFVTNKGFKTCTRYINDTSRTMIEKIILYNKQIKNDLDWLVWRIEAKVLIPNSKVLMLPFYELEEIIKIARNYYD